MSVPQAIMVPNASPVWGKNDQNVNPYRPVHFLQQVIHPRAPPLVGPTANHSHASGAVGVSKPDGKGVAQPAKGDEPRVRLEHSLGSNAAMSEQELRRNAPPCSSDGHPGARGDTGVDAPKPMRWASPGRQREPPSRLAGRAAPSPFRPRDREPQESLRSEAHDKGTGHGYSSQAGGLVKPNSVPPKLSADPCLTEQTHNLPRENGGNSASTGLYSYSPRRVTNNSTTYRVSHMQNQVLGEMPPQAQPLRSNAATTALDGPTSASLRQGAQHYVPPSATKGGTPMHRGSGGSSPAQPSHFHPKRGPEERCGELGGEDSIQPRASGLGESSVSDRQGVAGACPHSLSRSHLGAASPYPTVRGNGEVGAGCGFARLHGTSEVSSAEEEGAAVMAPGQSGPQTLRAGQGGGHPSPLVRTGGGGAFRATEPAPQADNSGQAPRTNHAFLPQPRSEQLSSTRQLNSPQETAAVLPQRRGAEGAGQPPKLPGGSAPTSNFPGVSEDPSGSSMCGYSSSDFSSSGGAGTTRWVSSRAKAAMAAIAANGSGGSALPASAASVPSRDRVAVAPGPDPPYPTSTREVDPPAGERLSHFIRYPTFPAESQQKDVANPPSWMESGSHTLPEVGSSNYPERLGMAFEQGGPLPCAADVRRGELGDSRTSCVESSDAVVLAVSALSGLRLGGAAAAHQSSCTNAGGSALSPPMFNATARAPSGLGAVAPVPGSLACYPGTLSSVYSSEGHFVASQSAGVVPCPSSAVGIPTTARASDDAEILGALLSRLGDPSAHVVPSLHVEAPHGARPSGPVPPGEWPDPQVANDLTGSQRLLPHQIQSPLLASHDLQGGFPPRDCGSRSSGLAEAGPRNEQPVFHNATAGTARCGFVAAADFFPANQGPPTQASAETAVRQGAQGIMNVVKQPSQQPIKCGDQAGGVRASGSVGQAPPPNVSPQLLLLKRELQRREAQWAPTPPSLQSQQSGTVLSSAVIESMFHQREAVKSRNGVHVPRAPAEQPMVASPASASTTASLNYGTASAYLYQSHAVEKRCGRGEAMEVWPSAIVDASELMPVETTGPLQLVASTMAPLCHGAHQFAARQPELGRVAPATAPPESTFASPTNNFWAEAAPPTTSCDPQTNCSVPTHQPIAKTSGGRASGAHAVTGPLIFGGGESLPTAAGSGLFGSEATLSAARDDGDDLLNIWSMKLNCVERSEIAHHITSTASSAASQTHVYGISDDVPEELRSLLASLPRLTADVVDGLALSKDGSGSACCVTPESTIPVDGLVPKGYQPALGSLILEGSEALGNSCVSRFANDPGCHQTSEASQAMLAFDMHHSSVCTPDTLGAVELNDPFVGPAASAVPSSFNSRTSISKNGPEQLLSSGGMSPTASVTGTHTRTSVSSNWTGYPSGVRAYCDPATSTVSTLFAQLTGVEDDEGRLGGKMRVELPLPSAEELVPQDILLGPSTIRRQPEAVTVTPDMLRLFGRASPSVTPQYQSTSLFAGAKYGPPSAIGSSPTASSRTSPVVAAPPTASLVFTSRQALIPELLRAPPLPGPAPVAVASSPTRGERRPRRDGDQPPSFNLDEGDAPSQSNVYRAVQSRRVAPVPGGFHLGDPGAEAHVPAIGLRNGRSDSTDAPESRSDSLKGSMPTACASSPMQQPSNSSLLPAQKSSCFIPTVTREELSNLFRRTPRSILAHEAVETARNTLPTAVHRLSAWPPRNHDEVISLLEMCNSRELIRHLRIASFSRQYPDGVQTLFDDWAAKGIPAPDMIFAAYYYYVQKKSALVLCMRHNGRGRTAGIGYGGCDFASRGPLYRCRFSHYCLYCKSEEHGWYDEDRCKRYQLLLAEHARLGIGEEEIRIFLDALEH